MKHHPTHAPGSPGVKPHWTASTKDGVGTARNLVSRVWFTIGGGILNEVYYPRVDRPAVRDLGLIVTDGADFFCEEKSGADSRVEWIEPGVPAFLVRNECRSGRFTITKEILADPNHHSVLQRIRFEPKQGRLADYRLFVLLAPHLADSGMDDTAELGDFKGVPLLQAHKPGVALALACSGPWLGRSAGFVGHSDGWQDLSRHKKMTWFYDCAADGNVALTGEIDLATSGGEFILALGFGRGTGEAGNRARASLQIGFEAAQSRHAVQWREWQGGLRDLGQKKNPAPYRVSTAVLSAHVSKDFRGGMVASLSIPWGAARGDASRAGYHVCWPRDAFEAAGALVAAGADEDARQCLAYLQTTQEADGHWPQNMWLDGSAHWDSIQLDEVAGPILLVDLARRHGVIDDEALRRFWPMARAAAGYLVRHGPRTQQDRWEENPGYTAFTLAAEIAALIAAAELAAIFKDETAAAYLRETADAWNESIERRIYAEGTELARKFGVEGYYVRAAPEAVDAGHPLAEQRVRIANLPEHEQATICAVDLVSPDVLALVRFGLRAADDPRIVNTLAVIDGLLKIETPSGPCWHRYNRDGYGEHADGAPFDGSGIGRAWPLLTGERAHYELQAGHRDEALRLCRALESFASESGLIPEQIWDAPDLPERGLFLGHPSHSARPLAWAHAEHIKLLRSLRDGAVFDLPPVAHQRYACDRIAARVAIWHSDRPVCEFAAGRILRIETSATATVHWSLDDWQHTTDTALAPSGFDHFFAQLPTASLELGKHVLFTIRWDDDGRWQGVDYAVAAVPLPDRT